MKKVLIELTPEQIEKIVESQSKKTNIEEDPLTFSIVKAAKRLGVGKTKIYEMINSGEIARIQIGKRPRILSSEINRILSTI